MKKLRCMLGLLPIVALAMDAPVVGITATMANGNGQILGDSVYVSLNWSPVPGAFQYRVYYSLQLQEALTLIGHTPSATFETAVPTGWDWPETSEVLGFFSVTAESLAVHFPEMVIIPAGQFMMGQAGVATPEHLVTLTDDFLLGRTEVTNQQYLEAVQWAYDQGLITATSASVTDYGVELLDLDDSSCQIAFSGGQFSLEPVHGGSYNNQSSADHPVIEVSWYGAACYCDWLSLMNGLPPYYNGNWGQVPSPNNPYAAPGYRLPTEAEWEFAAQHDDERTYPWGSAAPNCTLANYRDCVSGTSPVGAFPAGASSMGLEDMAGNVLEWNNDWVSSYSSSPQDNPAGPASGVYRVRRGGSWFHNAFYLPCAYRGYDFQSMSNSFLGFRLCRSLP